MKTIHRNKSSFQTILVWVKYLFFFGNQPQKEFTPYVFVSPVASERAKLKNAARRFELKKRLGGAAR